MGFFSRGYGCSRSEFGGFRGAGRGSDRGGGRGGMHGGRHGHGHGGPGFFNQMANMAKMRGARVLSSDDLQLVILALVDEQPRHGYDIIKSLEEKSSGIYKPSPGMIYPALTYLEEADLTTSSVEGSKKLVSITDQGKAFLKERRSDADNVFQRLKDHGERMANFQEQMNQEQQWRESADEFNELRKKLRSVLMEKFNASAEEKKRVFAILKAAVKDIRGK